MEPVETKIRAALERTGHAGEDTRLVVAVSGGPDSLALLYGLLQVGCLSLHVAHLNHDFRGEEAEEDARYAAEVAGQLGLPVTVERADPQAYQKDMRISSFEEAARELRYSFLARVAETTSSAAVAVGHTADDLAETVLMHIIRGSGLHGLVGMEELSTWRSRQGSRQVVLFRPLLEVTKTETVAYCRRRGVAFREDPGNLLPRFTRNRMRHELLPAMEAFNPRVKEALARLARTAQLGTDYIGGELARVWPDLARAEGCSVVLDVAVLGGLHPLIRLAALRRAYSHVAGDTRRLEESHLKAMADFTSAPQGRMLGLPRGLRLYTAPGKLVLGRGEGPDCLFPPLEGEHAMSLPSGAGDSASTIAGWSVTASLLTVPPGLVQEPFTAHLDLDVTGQRLWVRTRQPGDRFQPLGMQGGKKLQDFFVDEKVPVTWRDRVPLVVCERGIAWVVGYRIAEWARVKPDRDRICRIRFSPAQ